MAIIYQHGQDKRQIRLSEGRKGVCKFGLAVFAMMPTAGQVMCMSLFMCRLECRNLLRPEEGVKTGSTHVCEPPDIGAGSRNGSELLNQLSKLHCCSWFAYRCLGSSRMGPDAQDTLRQWLGRHVLIYDGKEGRQE